MAKYSSIFAANIGCAMVIEETNTVLYRMVNDDLLEMVYKDNAFLDVKETAENHHLYFDITREVKSMKRLIILGKNMTVSSEARLLCQKFDKEEEHRIKAQAIVAQCYLGRVLSYVYFKMFTPKYPNKVFVNKQKATEWLMQIN
ncbi:MAG: hypothetical protein ACLGGV_08090 [Bacteroidia bacterium]